VADAIVGYRRTARWIERSARFDQTIVRGAAQRRNSLQSWRVCGGIPVADAVRCAARRAQGELDMFRVFAAAGTYNHLTQSGGGKPYPSTRVCR
jgi:hypothetical protein